ncbi:MAG: DUF5702 domain-containing protein [Defluviitaleaceae bacterium]|nr:DUF5702 domain-containing protein [Defluviitaleaceae bacterium]
MHKKLQKKLRKTLRRMFCPRGTVSVFVLLMMIPMLAFTGLTIDFARLNMAASQATNAAHLAANADLAFYDSLLFELYGLIATSQRRNDREVNEIIYETLGHNGGFNLLGNVNVTQVNAGPNAERYTLENMAYMRYQILQYMSLRIILSFVDESGNLDLPQETADRFEEAQRELEFAMGGLVEVDSNGNVVTDENFDGESSLEPHPNRQGILQQVASEMEELHNRYQRLIDAARDANNANAASLSADANTAFNNMRGWYQNIADAEEEISTLESERATLQAQLAPLVTQRSSLQAQRTSLVASRNQLVTERNQLGADDYFRQQEIQLEIDALTDEIDELDDEINALTAEITPIQERITWINNRISTLISQINGWYNQIRNAATQIRNRQQNYDNRFNLVDARARAVDAQRRTVEGLIANARRQLNVPGNFSDDFVTAMRQTLNEMEEQIIDRYFQPDGARVLENRTDTTRGTVTITYGPHSLTTIINSAQRGGNPTAQELAAVNPGNIALRFDRFDATAMTLLENRVRMTSDLENLENTGNNRREQMERESEEGEAPVERDGEHPIVDVSALPRLPNAYIRDRTSTGLYRGSTGQRIFDNTVTMILLAEYGMNMFSHYNTNRRMNDDGTRKPHNRSEMTLSGIPLHAENGVNFWFGAEIEYLAFGNSSALRNFRRLQAYISTLRWADNFIYTFLCESLNNEINAFKKIPKAGIPLSIAYRIALTTLETTRDWNRLLNGGRVPLSKVAERFLHDLCCSSGNDNLFSVGFASYQTRPDRQTQWGTRSGNINEPGSRGLYYDQWLRLIILSRLLMGGENRRVGVTFDQFASRIATLIEVNMNYHLALQDNADAGRTESRTTSRRVPPRVLGGSGWRWSTERQETIVNAMLPSAPDQFQLQRSYVVSIVEIEYEFPLYFINANAFGRNENFGRRATMRAVAQRGY